MTKTNQNKMRLDRVTAAALLSVSCVALGLLAAPGKIHAQSSGVHNFRRYRSRRPTSRSAASPAPPARSAPTVRRSGARRLRAGRRPNPPLRSTLRPSRRTPRTGTVGVYSNSTSVATKTNTPLVNIPQSVSVVTKEFIRDQNFQSVTDVTRYVPGVAIHQGEGNRDELVIRGVDSSANFFVNGFRDDVQYFRDLYNTQSIEVLKGPSALIFGRGAGGGLVNRTLKEADGTRVYEATGQVGS